MDYLPLEVKVWSPMACFTRPELRTERVSYPTPTPSAARGILEAIFWKPEFAYRVREIHVLKPIQFCSILRNEVDKKASRGGVIYADDRDTRQQRHTLLLLDVAYVISADIVLRPHATDDVAKYRDQFQRRVQRGQCFHRPALGCREFAADFAPPDKDETPIDRTQNLGMMLFDVAFGPSSGTPLFWEAQMERGRVRVPDSLYDALGGLA